MNEIFKEALEHLSQCKNDEWKAIVKIKETLREFQASKKSIENTLLANGFLCNLWTMLILGKCSQNIIISLYPFVEELLCLIKKQQNALEKQNSKSQIVEGQSENKKAEKEATGAKKKKLEAKENENSEGFFGFLAIELPRMLRMSKSLISSNGARTYMNILFDFLMKNEGREKCDTLLSALVSLVESHKIELIPSILERIFSDLRVSFPGSSGSPFSSPVILLLNSVMPFLSFPSQLEVLSFSDFSKNLTKLRNHFLSLATSPELTPESIKLLIHLIRYFTFRDFSGSPQMIPAVFCLFSAVGLLFEQWENFNMPSETNEAKLFFESLRDLQATFVSSLLIFKEQIRRRMVQDPVENKENEPREEAKNEKKSKRAGSPNHKEPKGGSMTTPRGKGKKVAKSKKNFNCDFCLEVIPESDDSSCVFCQLLKEICPFPLKVTKQKVEDYYANPSFFLSNPEIHSNAWVLLGSWGSFSGYKLSVIDYSQWCFRKYEGGTMEIYKTDSEVKKKTKKRDSIDLVKESVGHLADLLFNSLVSCFAPELKGAFNTILMEALNEDASSASKMRLLELFRLFISSAGNPILIDSKLIKKALKRFIYDKHQRVREKAFKLYKKKILEKILLRPYLLTDKLNDPSEQIRQSAVEWLLCCMFQGDLSEDFYGDVKIQTELLNVLMGLFSNQRKAIVSLSKYAASFLLFRTFRNEDFCQILCRSRSLKKYDLMNKVKNYSDLVNIGTRKSKNEQMISARVTDKLLVNVFGEEERWGTLEELILYMKRKVPESFDSLTVELADITQSLLDNQSKTDSICSILPCVMLFAGESPSLIAKYLTKLIEMLQNGLVSNDSSCRLVARSIRKLLQIAQSRHQPLIESKVMQVQRIADEFYSCTETNLSLELLRLIFMISADYQTEHSAKSIAQIVQLLLKIILAPNPLHTPSPKGISKLTWALNGFCTFYKYFGRSSEDSPVDLTLLNIRMLKICQDIDNLSITHRAENTHLLQRAIVRFVFQITLLDQRFGQCLEALVSNTTNLDEASILFVTKKIRSVLYGKSQKEKPQDKMVIEKSKMSPAEEFCYTFLKEKASFLFSFAPISQNSSLRITISDLLKFVNAKREIPPAIYLASGIAMAFDEQKNIRENAYSSLSLIHKRCPDDFVKELFPLGLNAIFQLKVVLNEPFFQWWKDASPSNMDLDPPASPERLKNPSANPRTPPRFSSNRLSSARKPRQSTASAFGAFSFQELPFCMPFREIVDQCNLSNFQASKKNQSQKTDIFHQTLKSFVKILKGNKLDELLLFILSKNKKNVPKVEIVEFIFGMILTGKRRWPPNSVKLLIEAVREYLVQNSHRFSEESSPDSVCIGLVLVIGVITFSGQHFSIRQFTVLEKEISEQLTGLAKRNEEIEIRAPALRKNFKIMRENLEEGKDRAKSILKEFMFDGIGKTMVKWSFLQGAKRREDNS